MQGSLAKRILDGFAAAFLAALSLAVLATSAGAEVVSSEMAQSPGEIKSFWTPERMREAQPAAIPAESGTPSFSPPAQGSPAEASSIPPSRGRVFMDFQPGAESSFPQSVHGRIFMLIPAHDDQPEQLASCSGTVVSSRLQNVVFTAGHCAQFPGEPPASKMIFVPGYRDGAMPFGAFAVSAVLVPAEWASDFDSSYDVAVAELAAPIEQVLGARGIAFNKPPKTNYKIFGYPAEPSDMYDGERLIECDASLFGLELGLSHPFSNVVYPCDMAQGASGGGWVNPAGDVVSVNSHIYTDPSLARQIAGPFFGDAVKRLYNTAGGSAQCPPAKQRLKAAKGKARKARKLERRSGSRRAKQRLRKVNRLLSKARSKRDNYC